MNDILGVKWAWVFAAAFVGATIAGFVPNPLVGEGALFVTNTAHNLVHLATAIGFAVVALIGNKASTRFMLGFGAVYSLVGLLGFVALGSAAETHLLGVIHINFLDNFLHVGLGIAIAVAGYVAFTKARRAPAGVRASDAALEGYDLVAYFTENRPTKGNAEFASKYGGKQYHFASKRHQEMFDRAPQKYLPQYDGYCAFGVAAGQLFDVDPNTGQVIDGKLYLNLNKKIFADFNKDATGYIEKADKNWPEVIRQAAA